VFEMGWVGHFKRKFQGSRGRLPMTVGVSPWAITWLCLRDSMFSRFETIAACDRQTLRQTHRHTTMTNTRA